MKKVLQKKSGRKKRNKYYTAFFCPRGERGISLIELMIVVTIILILAALVGWGASAMRLQAERSTVTFEIVNTFRLARTRARSQNALVWYGVKIPQDGGGGIRISIIEDSEWVFDPENYDFKSTSLPSGSRHYQRRALSRFALVKSSDEFGVMDHIPSIFRPNHSLALSDSGCSFCDSEGIGWVRIFPRGEISFLTPGSGGDMAEAIIIGGSYQRVGDNRLLNLVAITPTFGIVEVFDNKL